MCAALVCALVFADVAPQSGASFPMPVVPASGAPDEAPLPTTADRQIVVNNAVKRIADWIKKFGDVDGDWTGDRARLEMQLATARLDLAATKLLEARNESEVVRRKD